MRRSALSHISRRLVVVSKVPRGVRRRNGRRFAGEHRPLNVTVVPVGGGGAEGNHTRRQDTVYTYQAQCTHITHTHTHTHSSSKLPYTHTTPHIIMREGREKTTAFGEKSPHHNTHRRRNWRAATATATLRCAASPGGVVDAQDTHTYQIQIGYSIIQYTSRI